MYEGLLVVDGDRTSLPFDSEGLDSWLDSFLEGEDDEERDISIWIKLFYWQDEFLLYYFYYLIMYYWA